MPSFLKFSWMPALQPLAAAIRIDNSGRDRSEHGMWLSDPLAHPDIIRLDQRMLGDLPAAELRARRLA